MERIELDKYGYAEVKEGYQSLIGISNNTETALSIRGNSDTMVNIICKVLVVILSNVGSASQAATLASIVFYLKKHGALAEDVDMAVALAGHVIPIDEIASVMFDDTKKDR